MFDCPGSERCPVKTVKNYLLHLNLETDFFQKPRALGTAKFDPEVDPIWFCNSSLGERSLAEMMKKMTYRAGISPHLTNHCIRAMMVTVLGGENTEARHIQAVTGHRSDASIDSYINRPSLKQFQEMSNILLSFVAENKDSSAGKSSTAGSTQVATSPLREAVQFNLQQVQQFQQQPQGSFVGCTFNIANNYNFGN